MNSKFKVIVLFVVAIAIVAGVGVYLFRNDKSPAVSPEKSGKDRLKELAEMGGDYGTKEEQLKRLEELSKSSNKTSISKEEQLKMLEELSKQ